MNSSEHIKRGLRDAGGSANWDGIDKCIAELEAAIHDAVLVALEKYGCDCCCEDTETALNPPQSQPESESG